MRSATHNAKNVNVHEIPLTRFFTMRKRIFIIAATLIAGAILFAYWERRHAAPRNTLVLYGNVDVRQVDMAFQVMGRVEKMPFDEGDLLQPGALMGVIDKRPYEDQVREAEANLEAVRVNYANAEKIFNRRQKLISDGGVSEEDLQNTETSKDVYAANLKQAEAALAIALTNLQYTEVFAPTEGTILTRIREPGSVVNVGDPIYTLSITSPVWIRAFVAEPDLGLIYPGMAATVHTDTPNGKVYEGHVGFISPVAEFTPKTVETTQLRTDLVYRLRIYADNPDRGLLQGMPVTVHLKIRQEAK